MPGIAEVVWKPQALQRSLKVAFVGAVKDVQKVAQAKNPAPSRIRIVVPTINTATGSAVVVGKGSLAHIFEGGRRGGYPIQPGVRSVGRGRTVKSSGGVAIKFTRGDGGFFRGAGFLGGPMAARPYMRPARDLFVTLYQRRAAAALRGVAGL